MYNINLENGCMENECMKQIENGCMEKIENERMEKIGE